jgi:hypothetical protein
MNLPALRLAADFAFTDFITSDNVKLSNNKFYRLSEKTVCFSLYLTACGHNGYP